MSVNTNAPSTPQRSTDAWPDNVPMDVRIAVERRVFRREEVGTGSEGAPVFHRLCQQPGEDKP